MLKVEKVEYEQMRGRLTVRANLVGFDILCRGTVLESSKAVLDSVRGVCMGKWASRSCQFLGEGPSQLG